MFDISTRLARGRFLLDLIIPANHIMGGINIVFCLFKFSTPRLNEQQKETIIKVSLLTIGAFAIEAFMAPRTGNLATRVNLERASQSLLNTSLVYLLTTTLHMFASCIISQRFVTPALRELGQMPTHRH